MITAQHILSERDLLGLRFVTIKVEGVNVEVVISRVYRPYNFIAYALSKSVPKEHYESITDPLMLLAVEHELTEQGHLKK